VSVLELKQQISKLSARERQEIQLYLLRLKRETPAWKKATARKVRAIQAGRGASIESLEARLSRG
jgi:hypothetical protein